MALNPDVLKGWPPGGWQFYEPSTDWHAPGPLQFTFTQQVANIIKMREANLSKHLPTDECEVRAELERYTEARLAALYSRNGIKKFLLEQPEDKKKGSSFTAFNMPRNGGGAVRVAINTATGLGGLASWLGEGGVPVARTLAESRAIICTTCDANKGGWLNKLTATAMNTVRALLALKNQMRLETSFDDRLQSCEACKCVLTLKVWQPPEFVKEGTTADTLEKHRAANAECWVVRELAKA